VARGIQNKVLEAMAMGRPVVVSSTCAGSLDAQPGRDFIAAGDAQSYAAAVLALFDPPSARAVGAAARARIEQIYRWDCALATLDEYLDVPMRDVDMHTHNPGTECDVEPGILHPRG